MLAEHIKCFPYGFDRNEVFMPYKDKEKQKQAVRKATQRYRKQGITETIPKCDQSVTVLDEVPSVMRNIEKAVARLLSRSKLYLAINHCPGNTWKDSPEFAELMRRLRAKSVEELESEGYWIPSWKYKEAA